MEKEQERGRCMLYRSRLIGHIYIYRKRFVEAMDACTSQCHKDPLCVNLCDWLSRGLHGEIVTKI